MELGLRYVLDLVLDREELPPWPLSFLRCDEVLLLRSLADRLLPLSGKRIPGPTSDARAALTASFVRRSSSSRFCVTVDRPALTPVMDSGSAGVVPRI